METEYRFQGKAATRWYKPTILRVPGLLLVFAVSVSLIGVLEYAARTLPGAEKESAIAKTAPGLLHLAQQQIAQTSTSSTPQFISSTVATAPGAYVHTSASTITTSSVAISTNPNAYVKTTGVSTSTTNSAPSTITPSATAPSAYVQTTGISTLIRGTPTTLAIDDTITPHPTIATSPGGYVQTNPSSSFPPVATTSNGAYINSSQTSPANSKHENDTSIPSWPLWKVFIGGYLPVLLAILFKVFWTSIYANVKLIEPFIQLSRPTGASAKDTFWSFYLSSNITPDPIVSLFKGRWLMFWTSTVYLVVGFLPPLASESLFRDTRYNCANPDPNQPNNPCWPRFSVDLTVVHLLQGLLSFVAIMTLTIMYLVLRSPTGISSDPSSIAFVASLIHHPDVLYDFRRTSGQATDKQTLSTLGKKNYQLGDYLGSDGVTRYGIIPGNPPSLLEDNIEMTHTSNEKKAGTATLKRFLDFGFVLFILGLLGVVLAYYKDGANDGFNRFFNSNTFGPRFFMSAMGSIVAMNLKRLEREVQTLSPFHRLAKSTSPAGPTILLRKYNTPFSAFIMLLARGHIFSASMAFVGVLSEALVVVLAAIPYSPGEIFLELIVCTYTSVAILSVMLLVMVILVFWRRQLPYLPRPPDTLGGVISYLCDSRMLYNFDQCTGLEDRELRNRISRLGKEYSYGEYVGVDGQVRWMIEESTGSSFGEK
ncbi:hypothetical protein N431DRAFT_563555 [Stipitochalara longipes BDJ]|nr:hypothetical protein N431DRAFT_563555 [Stipitochalara longipes BDJ]